MDSLLNRNRPPVFCPGCSHERVLRAVDRALVRMGYAGQEVVIVTDIGCSGLFDVFFNTHAFHGLHGRALTYATGIKMARPELAVIVTMGDGGLGIGGGHVLSTCRRNIDLTLLVLNNFNYGMTGGQCSATTPIDATVGSGFLNKLEKPLDICQVAGTAGAGSVARISTYDAGLERCLMDAIDYDGFALVDIWGVCPGRFTRSNKMTPKVIAADLAALPPLDHFSARNARMEYGRAYRREADKAAPVSEPEAMPSTCKPPAKGRHEVVLLGRAGQRIITAGELICLAGASAGCHATQKNDYPITVMRGHSVSEIILSDVMVGFTGIQKPSTVIALSQEGVDRRAKLFSGLTPQCLILKSDPVKLPPCDAVVEAVDFKSLKIKPADYALASLAVIACRSRALTMEMLEAALKRRFHGEKLDQGLDVVKQVAAATTT